MTFGVPPETLASQPLGSLDVVAFDTETTGLDIKKARIVEIGAVRVAPGQRKFEDTFSTLVNPGIKIPRTATGIHGIGDDDVASAPEFPGAMAEFARWAGPCLAVGYSVAFDIAVFEVEHARCRLQWSIPRVVDVQELVQALGPELPNWSLETVAAWLGISVGDRHRALPDALLAAQIFSTLIPETARGRRFDFRRGRAGVRFGAISNWRGWTGLPGTKGPILQTLTAFPSVIGLAP